MATWSDLESELGAWSAAGREATLWWRDDDATHPTPALERLLNIAAANHVPICLAVIPAAAHPGLNSLLKSPADVAIAVHGISHENFADPGEKKCELVEGRSPQMLARQLRQGFDSLLALAGDHTIPVVVPPWNRIAKTLLPSLPAHGFRGISTYGDRRSNEPTQGLLQVNCHVDPINWRGGRSFVGTEQALDMLICHLARRRLGSADSREPTGLLTHHAVWTDEAFAFLEEVFARTRQDPAIRWQTAHEVFGLMS